MSVYYNEIDPYCAQWLQNLMDAGEIPHGVIDTRSIEDVRPDDLAGYVQCHFFAGLGGWPLALALAGWPADRPVWTGSCPCQPFSAAGKGMGAADERHLWPAWFHLIRLCRPAELFGEQVAAAVGHAWLDGVCADLEGQGYAVGAAVLPACAAGAPHRRDRLWFGASLVDHADHARLEGLVWHGGDATGREVANRPAAATGRGNVVADADGQRSITRQPSSASTRHGHPADAAHAPGAWDNHAWITGHDGKARRVEPSIRLLAHGVPARVGRLRAYGNAIVPQVAAEFVSAFAEAEIFT